MVIKMLTVLQRKMEKYSENLNKEIENVNTKKIYNWTEKYIGGVQQPNGWKRSMYRQTRRKNNAKHQAEQQNGKKKKISEDTPRDICKTLSRIAFSL